MTNDRDTDLLGSELHDLVDGIAPDHRAGMLRAQRAIARRARNRHATAAAGAAGAVLLVAATVFVVVDRDTEKSQRPAGTTAPSVSTPATPAPTTTSTTVPGSLIESTIPSLDRLAPATASYSKTFAWGTADDEIAFHTPQGEGVSGGPVAFTTDGAGNIVMLDHSSSRIVRFEHGSAAAVHIALAGPTVTAAAIDRNGFVIVGTVGDVAVFGPEGQVKGAWPALSPTAITSLSIVDDFVYSDTDHNTRTPLLREVGGNAEYTRLFNAVPEPTPITVDIHPEDSRVFTMKMSDGGREYRITAADAFTRLRAARLLPDGTLAFALQMLSHAQSDDQPVTYVVGRITPDGNAQYRTITASMGYLVNGPEFVINDDGLAVMGSTTSGGVTVSYYPFG